MLVGVVGVVGVEYVLVVEAVPASDADVRVEESPVHFVGF
jgi:hypothetical protein